MSLHYLLQIQNKDDIFKQAFEVKVHLVKPKGYFTTYNLKAQSFLK